jgi:hypothetical protein
MFGARAQSYDVGRLHDLNFWENFQEQINTKLDSLKFDNTEDGGNNFRKIVCEVTDGALKKKDRNIEVEMPHELLRVHHIWA